MENCENKYTHVQVTIPVDVVLVAALLTVVVVALSVVLMTAAVFVEDTAVVVIRQFNSSLPSKQSSSPLHNKIKSIHFSLLKQRNSDSAQVTAKKMKRFNSHLSC